MKNIKLIVDILVIALAPALSTAQAGDAGTGETHTGTGITMPSGAVTFGGPLELPEFSRQIHSP